MSEDRLVPLSAENEEGKSSRVRRAFEGTRTKELQLAVEPLGVGQMLDRALEIFRAGFFRYVVIAGLVYLPERIAQVFFGEHLFGRDLQSGAFEVDDILTFYGNISITVVLAFLFRFIVLGTVTRMAYSDLEGRPESASSCLLRLAKRLPAFLLLSFVVSVGNVIGYMVCCVGLVFTGWKLQLVLPAFVLEDRSFADSFRRGWELTRGSLWRFLGLWVVSYLLFSGWGGIGNLPFSSMARPAMVSALGLNEVLFNAIFVPLSALFLGVGAAYIGVLAVVYYADQRVRLEGLDLAMKLDEFESTAADPLSETSD